jgi:proline iminopeptidase
MDRSARPNVIDPILLVIHGGPGLAFIPLAGSFQAPWEKKFTVVEWDQRGAGKTYSSNDGDLQERTMTVTQMEQDTLEVANYLRSRFHRNKILVLGHSWGSMLGLWLAHEHPDVLYAYVGVGQLTNPELDERSRTRMLCGKLATVTTGKLWEIWRALHPTLLKTSI